MKSVVSPDPEKDRKVAADIQYGRLTKHFSDVVIRIKLTRSALEFQLFQQNTSDYRASVEYKTCGFILEGQFELAFNDFGTLSEYKGCTEGCLDFPSWQNVKIVISVREYDLLVKPGNPDSNTLQSYVFVEGVFHGVKPDAWSVCIKCDLPQQEPEQAVSLIILQTLWTYLYPVVLAGVGMALDRFLHRCGCYERALNQFLDNFIYE